MIEEMLKNGFGLFAYFDGDTLRIGFMQTQPLEVASTAVEESGEPTFVQVFVEVTDPKTLDAESLVTSWDLISRHAAGMMYGSITGTEPKD